MIAHLGMYDMPALHGANDRYWQAIRARLGHGPDTLTRGVDFWDVWTSPDLLLSQTCGMPFRTRLADRVTLVGTPDYGLEGCTPGYYRSVLVVHADSDIVTPADLAGGIIAYNSAQSQSGWAAPMTHFTGLGVVFADHLASGGHGASALAVAEGRADVAGIDALTWELLIEHDPVVARLRVIGHTDPTPGLPYVTAPARDAAVLAEAVRAAIADLNPEDRAALHLVGLETIPASAYLAVPTPPGP